jgi:hypothetical protein
MKDRPWFSGPRENLEHGISLLETDSDKNRRLAMLSIDNAVELMVKTFLGLPRRVTGLNLARQKLNEISESFPKLLDALEEHAGDKLSGIDLGEIEWYHRLRNQLYHQGNGLTVEKDKVLVYAELAQILFSNLFGADAGVRRGGANERLGRFMNGWARLEQILSEFVIKRSTHTQGMISMKALPALRLLRLEGLMDSRLADEIDDLRELRNQIVHQRIDIDKALSAEVLRKLESIIKQLKKET